MTGVLLWLGLAGAANPWETLAPTVMALAESPLSPEARLAAAQLLLARPGWEEAGVEALVRLAAEPGVGPEAHAALVGHVGSVKARARWSDVYTRLLVERAFDGRNVILLRSAELGLRSKGTRSQSLAQMDRLLSTADAALCLEVGSTLLRGGEAGRSVAAFAHCEGGLGREGEALSALAEGDLLRASDVAQGGAPVSVVEGALQSPTSIPRAAALARMGFPHMAMRILEEDLRERTGLVLARLYRDEGRLPEATAALIRYRAAHPNDEAARRLLIDLHTQREQFSAAQALLTPAEAQLDPTLRPLIALRQSLDSRTSVGRDDRVQAAWFAAPKAPLAAREWARGRLEARQPEEALAALSPILDDNPADMEALRLHDLAAVGSGNSRSAVRRRLAAATAAPTARERAQHLAAAADLLVVQGEEAKAAGETGEAMDPYFTAFLIADATTDDLLAAGGLLWQLQHLDGAAAFYREVVRREPQNVSALLSGVRLLMQAGRQGEALALLEATRSKDKRAVLLHRAAINAVRAKQAREAADAGDLAVARRLWGQLNEEYPAEAEFRHGLGDVLAALGEYDAAIDQYREALVLDPNDAWAALAEASCLIALQKPEDARNRLDTGFPRGVDFVADTELAKVSAHAWRVTAQREQQAGSAEASFAALTRAFEIHPDPWSLSGLAALYLSHDQPEVALAFWDEALALKATQQEALAGRALALEKLGRWEEARLAASALDRPDATPASQAKRREILQRLTVLEAETERRQGNAVAAIVRLRGALDEVGDSADLWTALASAALDRRDCATALDALPRALDLAPDSRWALGVALRAGRVCASAEAVHAWLVEADERVGGGFASSELRASAFEIAIQEAERMEARGRRTEAVEALKTAEASSQIAVDDWARLGGAWLSVGKAHAALEAFQRALALEPYLVAGHLGVAGAYRYMGRLGAAERHLQAEWEGVADPRVGIALVQVLLARGQYHRAAEVLAAVKQAPMPPAVEPMPPASLPAFPVLPLPSGRVPAERTWPLPPARDHQPEWLLGLVDSVDLDLARETGVFVVAGAGAFTTPGAAGQQSLDGVVVPVDIAFAPIGSMRLGADAVGVQLDDGVDQAMGVSTSLGVSTAPGKRFFAAARLGTSPFGFERLTPVFHGHARYGVNPDLAVGAQVRRTPVSDSLLSWAGKQEDGGEFFGFVQAATAEGYLSWTPRALDMGAMFRGGFAEGAGVAPNPLIQGVAWAAGTLGPETRTLTLGAQLVGMHHDRQSDGFIQGQGGYFSPPVFLMAVARVVGTVGTPGTKGRACASVSAGPQYLDGQPNPWFGTGLSGTGRAAVGATWRLAPVWSIGVDARVQVSTSGWHQEGAVAYLTYGMAPPAGSASTWSTMASAGAILPRPGDLCRSD